MSRHRSVYRRWFINARKSSFWERHEGSTGRESWESRVHSRFIFHFHLYFNFSFCIFFHFPLGISSVHCIFSPFSSYYFLILPFPFCFHPRIISFCIFYIFFHICIFLFMSFHFIFAFRPYLPFSLFHLCNSFSFPFPFLFILALPPFFVLPSLPFFPLALLWLILPCCARARRFITSITKVGRTEIVGEKSSQHAFSPHITQVLLCG